MSLKWYKWERGDIDMVVKDKRVRIVEMLEMGERPTHIARKLKVSRNTVYRVKKESAEGELKDLKENKPKKVGIEQGQVIKILPNTRMVLAQVPPGGRIVRVVKNPKLQLRPKSKINVMEVSGDVFRLV